MRGRVRAEHTSEPRDAPTRNKAKSEAQDSLNVAGRLRLLVDIVLTAAGSLSALAG